MKSNEEIAAIEQYCKGQITYEQLEDLIDGGAQFWKDIGSMLPPAELEETFGTFQAMEALERIDTLPSAAIDDPDSDDEFLFRN